MLSIMQAGHEHTEEAIGQGTEEKTARNDISPVNNSGTGTAATLTSEQIQAPEDNTGGSQASTVAAVDGQNPSPVPTKIANIDPFGLKPEYKTALKDFFVCLSRDVLKPSD